jgi:hypothetical protein
MVERVQIKDTLQARNCGSQWAAHLQSSVSSAELVYDCKLVLPGEFYIPVPKMVV